MAASDDYPVLSFPSEPTWEKWLAKHHERSPGIWLRIHKKGSDTPTITYAQALDVALCYGWIDSQKQTYDETSWIQKFTPRRAKSPWSKINTGHAERLIAEGRMRPAGMRQIELAKDDGRWARGYNSSRTMTLPDDFLAALATHKRAKAFFESLNRANQYAIAYRLQTAKKPETRARRMATILEMLKKGETFH